MVYTSHGITVTYDPARCLSVFKTQKGGHKEGALPIPPLLEMNIGYCIKIQPKYACLNPNRTRRKQIGWCKSVTKKDVSGRRQLSILYLYDVPCV